GTKDAPVDGLDGKPHAGPFVDSSSTKKKPQTVEDIVPSQKTSKQDKDDLLDPDGATEQEKEQHRLLMEAQDTVMDDPHREAPKEGTTGTEGGVSERDRLKKAQEETKAGPPDIKRPESPKEVPPLPESEEPKSSKEKTIKHTTEEETSTGSHGLEKPADLPDKPHDIPHPAPPGTQTGDPLSEPPVKAPADTSPSTSPEDEPEGIIQPFHSFVLSLAMILFSEIGDKTFLVAALMAMRHPRMVVFSAAFSALITMTVLSAVLGHAVPTLLPKRFTNFAAAVLFLVFGAKMLREGWKMSPNEGVGEEMREVEMELEEKEHSMRRKSRRKSSITPYALEAGRGRRSRSDSRLPPPRSPSTSPSPAPNGGMNSAVTGLSNLLGLLLSPAWVQTFIMTFLGEWGDRSQIATIAMAAGQDYWWVTGGAISGHAVCTGIAVLGGKAIAGRVSMRVVTLGGAYAFLVFGIIYLFE
ncbi:UPF0016-domain-containing protein, partial [Rhizodiscina lignyota]